MAWDEVCTPYSEGVLGIRSFKDTIFGLQGKLAWKVFAGNTLWTRILRQKYGLDSEKGVFKRAQSASALWRQIYPHFQNFEDIGIWSIGRGQISFWRSNWVGEILDRTSSSNIKVREGVLEIDKWKPALTNEQWKRAQFVVFDNDVSDQLRCTLNAAGTFRVAEYLNHYRRRRPKKEWTDVVWNKFTNERVKAFNWKVCRGALPVDSMVQSRGIPMVSRCICCRKPKVETIEHLMIHSDIAQSLWGQFASKLHKISRVQSIGHLRQVWLHGVNRRSQMGMITLAIILYGMWEIWKVRCRMKYEDERVDNNQLLIRVYQHIHDISRVNHPKREATTLDRIVLDVLNCPVRSPRVKRGRWLRWLKQRVQQIKLNVDGTYRNGASGGGGIVRDSNGDFICGFTVPYQFEDATESEIQTLHDGMVMCVEKDYTRICIESDAAMVVNMVNGASPIPWRYVYQI